ncbi:ATP-binding protein [Streptomyces sp. NBC_01643]|uniref:ATP-binding protein n=1 Tax=Streptomyces sp. NBC_01643 TaxID=2975906 RepID=UPI002F912C58|nr:ATP-binding protein [Streptomyces sp. NBC_01643]
MRTNFPGMGVRQTRTPRTSRLLLTDTARPVAAARQHTRCVLTTWQLPDPVIEDALLVTAEVATNAEQHAAGALELWLALSEQGGLVIMVRDGDRCRPAAAAHADEDAECGRGLAIVSHLARRHGCLLLSHGKVVWANLSVTGEPEQPPACTTQGRNREGMASRMSSEPSMAATTSS